MKKFITSGPGQPDSEVFNICSCATQVSMKIKILIKNCNAGKVMNQ